MLVSFVLVLAASLALARRSRPRQAASWLGAWLAGNVVEVVGKAIVSRPALYAGGLHVVGFDRSYPSGHTIRALIAAAAAASVWPRFRPLLAWALTVPVALVVLGDHTPTDIAGGLLLAVALVAAASTEAARARPGRRPRSQPPSGLGSVAGWVRARKPGSGNTG